jgi:hypothetical protein
VAGHPRPVGAFATFVVFAWRDRTETSSRPRRSPRSTAKPRRARQPGEAGGHERRRPVDPSHRRWAWKAARPGAAPAARPRSASIVGYGFWIFLLSDMVMFSAFFAAYAVLAAHGRRPRAGASCST